MQSWVKFSDRSGLCQMHAVCSIARVGCAMHEDLEVLKLAS